MATHLTFLLAIKQIGCPKESKFFLQPYRTGGYSSKYSWTMLGRRSDRSNPLSPFDEEAEISDMKIRKKTDAETVCGN